MGTFGGLEELKLFYGMYCLFCVTAMWEKYKIINREGLSMKDIFVVAIACKRTKMR